MKDDLGREVSFAATTVIDALSPYVQQALDAIYEVCLVGPAMFVSDGTHLWDFLDDEDAECAQLSKRFGFTVCGADSLTWIATKLRDK